MADTSKIAEMLEHLLNNDQAKAEELFHEYVVAASREIYENLIDADLEEASDEEKDENDDVEEGSEASSDSEDLDEEFEDVALEAGDETDDFENDIEADSDEEGDGEEGEEGEFGGEEGEDEEGEATKGDIKDLAADIAELTAAFQSFLDQEAEEPAHQGDEMPSLGDEMQDDVMSLDPTADLATVREYVEKVDGHGAEKKGKGEEGGANTKSIVAGKNDMGGTAGNIVRTDTEAGVEANKGALKGNGLLKGKAQDMNTGNVNKVGGTNAKAFYSKNSQGHGAEKAGSKESGVDATSLIRGSR